MAPRNDIKRAQVEADVVSSAPPTDAALDKFDSVKSQPGESGIYTHMVQVSLTRAEEKKLMRRIDWHLLPLLALLYMIKTVDYINVSAFSVSHYYNSVYHELTMKLYNSSPTRVPWI